MNYSGFAVGLRLGVVQVPRWNQRGFSMPKASQDLIHSGNTAPRLYGASCLKAVPLPRVGRYKD